MKKVFHIVNRIFCGILLLILCLNIYLFFARVALKQDLPKIFGYANAVVLTGSMSGSIEAGDMVIIKEQPHYQIGDVVTYRANSLITHRIIEATEKGFITKGDANNTGDGEIATAQIEGKVVMVIPKIGIVIQFLTSPLGILLMVVIFFLLIELPYIVDYLKSTRKTSDIDDVQEKKIAD